jgi:hypothetical protein
LDEVHESGDLGDFGNEADAIAYAHKWAIEWIDERMNPVVRLKDKNDKDKDKDRDKDKDKDKD